MTAVHLELQDRLVERFRRYSRIPSQSDAQATSVPSTPGQRELAELLAAELRDVGARDVHLSDTSVLTARIPASAGHEDVPAVGFCAHLDTADVHLSAQVHPQLVDYAGGDICLDPDRDLWLRLSEHPELARYAGDRILVTDGTSVLGADDKAALAVLMEAAAELLGEGCGPHGQVYLAIVPDEEIGLRGVRTLELDRFPVELAWTIDSCEVGEIVAQTFNAASASVLVEGVPAHPMSAKGVLVNPVLVAHDLIAEFDRTQTPECTDGTDGFIWVTDVVANESRARVDIVIRDHDLARFEERKETVRQAAQVARERHPRAKVEVTVEDVYGNIADAVTADNRAGVDLLFTAMDNLGITPRPTAMRGGTDGSWLSRQGILTPNFFTGGMNFHSSAEFLPLGSFQASHDMVLELVRLVALG